MRTCPFSFSNSFSSVSDFPSLYSPPGGVPPSFLFSQDAVFAEDGASFVEIGLGHRDNGDVLSFERGFGFEAALPLPPPRKRVSFQEGIEEPPTSKEGIAHRKEVRRQEVQRGRHRELTAIWDHVLSLPLGPVERHVAKVLIGAAIGLNQWPKVGTLLKWRPFQSHQCLERLSGSLEECHRELWQEIESFVLMTIQGRMRGALWSWEPDAEGPWVETLERWPGVDALLAGLFELTTELDEQRRSAGAPGELFSLSEALLLTLSRELFRGHLRESIETWMQCPQMISSTAHPLLDQTVVAWQSAAATTGDFEWADFLLGVLRGDPDHQGHLFTLEEGSLVASPCESPVVPPGTARLASLAGPHAVGPVLDRVVAELATQAFQRGQVSEARESAFWKGMVAIDGHNLLPPAVQALAAEEPRMLARMGRLFFPPTEDEHLDLATRLASALTEALVQEQVERIQRSSLNEAQRLWLAQGFRSVADAVGRNPDSFSPLLQFLHREQMELEALGDRPPRWQKAWDWRAELFALEMAKTGADSHGLEQVRGWLRELHRQLCELWPDSADQAPSASQEEALRRAEFMLTVEEVGETIAVESVLHRSPVEARVSPFSLSVSTGLGELSRAELAALESYVIERLRRVSKPHQLRAVLTGALPLVTTGLSAQSLLFGDDEFISESGFGGIDTLRGLMKQCLLGLVSRRVATTWASMAIVPANAAELQHCVETMRLTRRVFEWGLPQELQLRFARVMRHPEIAQQVKATR